VEGYTPDAVDKLSARPDFMILVYPVISMKRDITHMGSRNNLLGPGQHDELVELLSNELQVTHQSPPTFLILVDDDTTVVPENSIRFYQALQKAHVPAEMHIFPKGGHGFGMRVKSGPLSLWTTLCENWIDQLNLPSRKSAN
jgi:acetyl esterase/lipase